MITSRFLSANLLRQAGAATAAPRAAAPFRATAAPWRIRTPQQARFLSDGTRQAIDKAVASAPVVLFMKGTPETPQCGFSRASIQVLSMQGVDPAKFAAFNVLEDPSLREGVLRLSRGGREGGRKDQEADDTPAPRDETGIKEYSEWPTIPQLYVEKEFIGGCDILVSMHKSGELAKLLAEKKVLADEPAEEPSKSS
ncbi:hypothetical protein RB594_008271 [Gaeumannomyces avenae]